MEETLNIINKTKQRLPSLPYSLLKNEILGEKYSLSIAFVNEKTSKEFNKIYRNKDKSSNILSFPLHKNAGEIILTPSLIKRDAKNKNKNFGKTFPKLLGFLVIHGMLHLKGMQHSSTMEKAEKKYDQKYFYRDRCGILYDKSLGRRIFKRRKKS